MSNGDKTFAERQAIGYNQGEQLFEEYCKQKGYKVTRLGFDEKNNPVDNYFRLSHVIRNLPDYVVNTGKETFVVNVKGTRNFKKEELANLVAYEEMFSTKEAPLVYAFCFPDKTPIMVYPEKIIFLYQQEQDQQFASDGKIYRKLNV